MERYFNKEEIEKITTSDKVKDYNRNILDNRTTDLFDFLLTKKFTIEQIRNTIKEFPRLLTYKIELTSNNYNNLEPLFKKTNK